MLPFTDRGTMRPQKQERLSGLDLMRKRLRKIEAEREFALAELARENANEANRAYRAQLRKELRDGTDFLAIFGEEE